MEGTSRWPTLVARKLSSYLLACAFLAPPWGNCVSVSMRVCYFSMFYCFCVILLCFSMSSGAGSGAGVGVKPAGVLRRTSTQVHGALNSRWQVRAVDCSAEYIYCAWQHIRDNHYNLIQSPPHSTKTPPHSPHRLESSWWTIPTTWVLSTTSSHTACGRRYFTTLCSIGGMMANI